MVHLACHIQTIATAVALLIGCETLLPKNTLATSQKADIKTLSDWAAWYGLLQEAAVFG
jgi:hypothetical protein